MLFVIVIVVSDEILEFSFKQLIIELELTGVRSLSSSSASLNRPWGGWWMREGSEELDVRFGTWLLESK